MTIVIIVFGSTAVASVPVAAAVVVAVVALFVLNPSKHLACLVAFGLCVVQTLALVTVFERICSVFLVSFQTAVATVPIATALIVGVITRAVTLPCLHSALRDACAIAFEVGIAALAF